MKPESQGGFDDLPAPVALSTVRAIQGAIELAIIQGVPVMNWHLLFGIIMLDDTPASDFLKAKNITTEEILDKIPNYFPDTDPPF